MTDHTTGPWKAVLADEKAIKWYITANIPGMQNSETEIAVVCGGKIGEKSEKNAILMAAAPDLLAACKALESLCCEKAFSTTELEEALGLACEAIAKAEGRA